MTQLLFQRIDLPYVADSEAVIVLQPVTSIVDEDVRQLILLVVLEDPL